MVLVVEIDTKTHEGMTKEPSISEGYTQTDGQSDGGQKL